jgi:hypothetical protein
MLEKGLLTREEFDLMKAKIIGLPTNGSDSLTTLAPGSVYPK